jgi:hypothetical protein
MVLCFHCEVDEICALVGCYAVYTGNVYMSCKSAFCYIVGLYAVACRDVPKSFRVLCNLSLILLTLIYKERHSSQWHTQDFFLGGWFNKFSLEQREPESGGSSP